MATTYRRGSSAGFVNQQTSSLNGEHTVPPCSSSMLIFTAASAHAYVWKSDPTSAEVSPSHLRQAIPFIPAVFIISYTLLILFYRYFVPRLPKGKLDILTHDPVTIDDIPDAEPIPRKFPFWKIILRVCTCFVRLGIEIYFLVCACLSTAGSNAGLHKLEIALYSTYVGLWVSRDFLYLVNV